MADGVESTAPTLSWRSLVGLLVLLGLIGAAVTGFLLLRPEKNRDGAAAEPQPAERELLIAPSPSPHPPAVQPPTAGPGLAPGAGPGIMAAGQATPGANPARSVASVAQQQGGLEQRLGQAEERLARLDQQTQAAAGNAARAEGLLIAFAARRAIERGNELGYLADQLRLRFGDALPNAVGTLVVASRDPVTMEQLLAELDALEPKLTARATGPSFRQLRRELSQLFVIRRTSGDSPRPRDRVERARADLENGRYGSAIREVEAMPGSDNAGAWIARVRRYAATQRALDLIETAAIMEPRRLRDGNGAAIEQPGPVRGPSEN